MDQSEFVEIAVGATILGLRRINIARRDLVERMPEAEPAISAVLEGLESRAEPASAALAKLIECVGDAIGGSTGEQLGQAAPTVRVLGPKLLDMSGLTAPIKPTRSAETDPDEPDPNR